MTNLTMLCANRPALLRQSMDSIGDMSDATLTIRDACINTEVTAIASRFFPNTTCVPSPEPCGTGDSRNRVIRASEFIFGRGDYLYISDDDVAFLRSDWLACLIEAYEEAKKHGFLVVAAYNHPFNRPIDGRKMVKVGCGEVYPVYAVATQSMLMSWDVWDKYGPFCMTPIGKVCQSEDVDFCNRIRSDGFSVGVVSPPLLVNTGITNSFGEKIVGWEMVKAQAPQGVVVE